MQTSRITLATLMVVALAACSSGQDSASDEQSETPPGVVAASVNEGVSSGTDAENSSGPDTASAEAGVANAGEPETDVSATNANEHPGASEASAAAIAPKQVAIVPAAFAQCRSCHAVEPGKNRIGPSLAGVFGAKAGHVDSYNYSTALKDAGLIWDAATLDSYLKSPREKVPGTKMTFPGVKNDAARAEVILYLKAL